MISKSPLIERLNQPKAKKHSCYCKKGSGKLYTVLKITVSVYPSAYEMKVTDCYV